MIRRFKPAALLAAPIALAVLAGAPASAQAASSHPLVGTFKLSPGVCFGDAVTGTYFRMIFPNGSVTKGQFFTNPDSTCANKTFTLAIPGKSGGLETGKFQPSPSPAFNAQGGAL